MTMSIRTKFFVATAVAVLVAGVVALQEVASNSGGPARAAVSSAAAASAAGNGTSEGIDVHGHWKISVVEPGVGVVSVREFDNALTFQGERLLSSVLSGNALVGSWAIEIAGQLTGPPYAWLGPCHWTNGQPTSCWMVEATWPGADNPRTFETLEVSRGDCDDNGTNCRSVVMTGAATPAMDSEITHVRTINSNNGANDFTQHSLDPVVPVNTGQQVLVEVEISFS